MATQRFSDPNAEQVKLLRECNIDPAGYVVRCSGEDSLCLTHLKSRHEIVISINRRVSKDNGNS